MASLNSIVEYDAGESILSHVTSGDERLIVCAGSIKASISPLNYGHDFELLELTVAFEQMFDTAATSFWELEGHNFQ